MSPSSRWVATTFALLALTGGGCGRADLRGSPQTKAKYDNLSRDPLYRAQLSGVPVAGIPIINAGSAGDGPGDSPTAAYQQWHSPNFRTNAPTAVEVVTFALEHGVSSFSAPRCSSRLWTVSGLKQYGPWVAQVAFFLEPGKVSVDTQLGVGDDGRETLAEARSRSRYLHRYDPPSTSKGCPAELLARLKQTG